MSNQPTLHQLIQNMPDWFLIKEANRLDKVASNSTISSRELNLLQYADQELDRRQPTNSYIEEDFNINLEKKQAFQAALLRF